MLPTAANPGLSLGTLLGMATRHGRDKVTLVIPEPIHAFGAWAEQLLAESTGKEGLGIVPVDGEALGSPDVYSHDRVFVSLHVAGRDNATTAKQLATLEAAGHPVARISIPEAIAFGDEFFRWELATATAGAILCVNPFDEPVVDESKQHTRDLLSAWQRQGAVSQEHFLLEADSVTIYGDERQQASWRGHAGSMRDFLQAFIGQMQAPDYLALLPYFQHTPVRHQALQELRGAVRDRFRVATTLGYGPRYLHSPAKDYYASSPRSPSISRRRRT